MQGRAGHGQARQPSPCRVRPGIRTHGYGRTPGRWRQLQAPVASGLLAGHAVLSHVDHGRERAPGWLDVGSVLPDDIERGAMRWCGHRERQPECTDMPMWKPSSFNAIWPWSGTC